MQSLERIRKAIVAGLSVATAYAGIAADVLGESDLSTRDGVIAALFALLVAFGVYQVPNAPPR
jgi:hypothetical protein